MTKTVNQVVVVDYGMGNIKSVQRSLEYVGAKVIVSSDPAILLSADKVVLPGVGAFEEGMAGLWQTELVDTLKEYVQSGKSLLGICLGMQMMLERSKEHGEHQGLGLIPGAVVEIPKMDGKQQVRKIPHIGWSALHYPAYQYDWSRSILRGTQEREYFYFVHSYMVILKNDSHLLAQCDYEGLCINAAIKKDNITGLQFHPEKSGEFGLKILREFVVS